jgi:predicted permease
VFLTSFDTQLAQYPPERTPRFYSELLTRMRAAPGIRSAALTSSVPMQTSPHHFGVVPEGRQLGGGERTADTLGVFVSDGYFETMQIAILQGREFREADGLNTPLVAVVNEQMARHHWGGQALGKRFHLEKEDGPLVEIVGVAKMAKYLWIAEAPADFVYLPSRQHPRPAMTLLTQSSAPDAAAVAPVIRDVLRKLDPDMPGFMARTMRNLYTDMGVKASDLIVDLVGAMGIVALVLASVGLYGLVAYSVSRRAREIGIRMALGAGRRAVVWMVLGQGLRLALAGVAVGLVFAHYACRIVAAAFDLSNIGIFMFAAAALPLLVVTALAAWSPAARAAQVDPLTSVRQE